ncbi:MAG: signal peptidase I [Spirochaetales bacterium]|nr:signal peptidase I [Spirochaetales bacterium]
MTTKGRGTRALSAGRIIAVAVAAALAVRAFGVDLVIVRGDSMNPTIAPGTVALVATSAYGLRLPLSGRYVCRWGEPLPGEIVVAEIAAGSHRRSVKRVFEVGPAYVNGNDGVLFARGGIISSADRMMASSSFVPPGYLFLVGDNAEVSLDSRKYGPVPIEKITGKVLLYIRGRSGEELQTAPSKDAADDVDR